MCMFNDPGLLYFFCILDFVKQFVLEVYHYILWSYSNDPRKLDLYLFFTINVKFSLKVLK
uniref:Uncharacterized protein n=1 Tax=Anguilla anguilla TaxID=7936 RepID=A0A0E9Q4L3_ANGAN